MNRNKWVNIKTCVRPDLSIGLDHRLINEDFIFIYF